MNEKRIAILALTKLLQIGFNSEAIRFKVVKRTKHEVVVQIFAYQMLGALRCNQIFTPDEIEVTLPLEMWKNSPTFALACGIYEAIEKRIIRFTNEYEAGFMN